MPPSKPAPARSFMKAMFQGRLEADLVFPYPRSSDEERETLALVLDTFRDWARDNLDGAAIDEAGVFPEESIKAICEWAGVDFVPQMIASEGGGSKEDGKSEKAHAIQRRASDAHKVLSAEEIEKIMAACGPWLEQWSTPGALG